MAELVQRTAAYLAGHPLPESSGHVTEGQQRLVEEVGSAGRAVIVLDPPQVTVAAADRPGLLASVAGVLALHGLDVRSADATSVSGVAVEVFTVEVPRGSWPDSARLREDLEAVLADRLVLHERLAARAADYAGGRRPWSARTITPQVTTDNEASASSTVLEIRARDEVGLLHRVTQALFDSTLDVVSARVSTIGHEVVDAFYVRTADGEKVTDPGQLRSVEAAVLAAAG